MEMIGVEVGEPFEVSSSSFNPFKFDIDFNLVDREGDIRTDYIGDILWGEAEIKKISKDPNENIKKCIELLSNEALHAGDVRKGVLLSLKEILELKESKSVS